MDLSIKECKRLKSSYGEWAIVTGASSGIGFAIAEQLAKAGFNLIINARNEETLNIAANKLASGDIEIITVATDASEPEGIEKIVNTAGSLNVGLLVNNAGYGTSGLFVDSALSEEIAMLRVNCEAVLSLTHHFAHRFKQQQKGGIIFLSSLVAFQGVPYAANYSATKAYIQSFAEALAAEMKPFGVDILAAAPGPVSSGFAERAKMNMGKAIPADKLGAPILAALGKHNNVIPGLLSKILVYSLRTVPRAIKIKIMQKIMSGFTQHQRA